MHEVAESTLLIQLVHISGPQTVQQPPKAVKECSSLDSFKKTLDEYIMSLPDMTPLQLQAMLQLIILIFLIRLNKKYFG